MCVIICCDKRSGHIKPKMLKNAEKMNSDGMGIAWINRKGLVQWKKGLNSKQVSRLIRKEKPSLTKGYIVHARIASIGDVCPELTHPFVINQEANSSLEGMTDKPVLFHNGTWTEYEDITIKTLVKQGLKMYKGKNSDSRAMAFLSHIYGIEFLQLLKTQKIAILTKDGIRKFGGFPEVDKFSCSNDYFKNPSTFYYGGSLAGMNGGFDDGFYGNYNYSDNVYCPDCDTYKDVDQFTYDYDTCNECFMKKQEGNLDLIAEQSLANAKQLMPKQDNIRNWYSRKTRDRK